jgi:hypothetical protein
MVWADMVDTDSGHTDVPLAYFASVIGTLAPHLPPGSLTWTNSANCDKECDGPSPSEAHGFLSGVHAAIEVRDGLEDISATLQMHGIAHEIVTDDLAVGAHIDAHMESRKVSARFIWGSSVHYTDASTQRHLVPAAQFQVAALQAEEDITVIVVPHWSWPMQGDNQSKTRCLMDLANQSRKVKVPHPMVVPMMPDHQGVSTAKRSNRRPEAIQRELKFQGIPKTSCGPLCGTSCLPLCGLPLESHGALEDSATHLFQWMPDMTKLSIAQNAFACHQDQSAWFVQV